MGGNAARTVGIPTPPAPPDARDAGRQRHQPGCATAPITGSEIATYSTRKEREDTSPRRTDGAAPGHRTEPGLGVTR